MIRKSNKRNHGPAELLAHHSRWFNPDTKTLLLKSVGESSKFQPGGF